MHLSKSTLVTHNFLGELRVVCNTRFIFHEAAKIFRTLPGLVKIIRYTRLETFESREVISLEWIAFSVTVLSNLPGIISNFWADATYLNYSKKENNWSVDSLEDLEIFQSENFFILD